MNMVLISPKLLIIKKRNVRYVSDKSPNFSKDSSDNESTDNEGISISEGKKRRLDSGDNNLNTSKKKVRRPIRLMVRPDYL
jgi:hypothetical protein